MIIDVPTVTCQSNVLPIELVLDQHVPLLQTLYQPLVVGNKKLDVLPVKISLNLQAVSLTTSLLAMLNRIDYKEAYPLLLFLEHRP
jgi:hypothetical protein